MHCGFVLLCYVLFFFFKQKTAYEMRISDWSSDVCSSDLVRTAEAARTSLQGGLTLAFRSGAVTGMLVAGLGLLAIAVFFWYLTDVAGHAPADRIVIDSLVALAFGRSEEHTSELQSLMRISYAVFCLKKKNNKN